LLSGTRQNHTRHFRNCQAKTISKYNKKDGGLPIEDEDVKEPTIFNARFLNSPSSNVISYDCDFRVTDPILKVMDEKPGVLQEFARS